MKKKIILIVSTALSCVVPISASPIIHDYGGEKEVYINSRGSLSPYTYDLDPGFVINQNVNEKGLVVVEGKLTKPFMTSNVKLSIKYKDSSGNWVTAWCKILYSYNQYNENVNASFELPASGVSSYNLKIELSSDANLSNFSSIIWDKSTKHYRQGDYANANCDLDENEYTILLTPKKEGSLVTDASGKVTGIKDRVTSVYSWNKLGNVLMDNKKNNVIFSPTNPATLLSVSGVNSTSKSVKMTSSATGAVLGSTPDFIYDVNTGHPSPYLYSYNDPVYMFAGKFSINGLMMKFSQWPGDIDGQGYHNFQNPNQLQSRYFNVYNNIYKKLSEFMTDQEPIVIVSSQATGLRVYKSNGNYITLDATSNYGAAFFGYGNDQGGARRGPGSESLSISNTSEMTLYGMGALRNDATTSSQSIRSISDINSEIAKFINYVGIFGDSKLNSGECSNACFSINSGALPDDDVVDWTKAPNSYIFTGKDKNENDVDGLYIPVKKAYEMWEKGGEFMKDEQGNYTKIPLGTEKAGLYWEDEVGLIKSVSLEGTKENGKIKILVNKLKKGNAVISYRINDVVYWTWHVWVTDDPRKGSNYHQGFEEDKNGNLVTDWQWMDRNLGATNAKFIGSNFHKSGGLQYQWGRKDPFPSNYKDFTTYNIRGEVGSLTGGLPTKYRGNLYAANNTGFDSPNGNIRYSINNPINYIIPPTYLYKIGETPTNNGENYLQEINTPSGLDWERKDKTTWFSKNSYKNLSNTNQLDNVTWDLWGDTRNGKWSNVNTKDPSTLNVANESKRYAMKSPYDPCPCGWRVPSAYSSVSAEANTSPWGESGKNTTTIFQNQSANSDYEGIKVYPGYGFEFSSQSKRNFGMIPINGNYEYYPQEMSVKHDDAIINSLRDNNKLYKNPTIGFQDQHSDGGLHTSTFFSSIDLSNPTNTPVIGTRGLLLISDAANVPNHSDLGYHRISSNLYKELNAYESRGVRCIKDPNDAYMPKAFETNYVYSSPATYTIETLKSWTKEPNSYIEYTDSSLNTDEANKDRVIEIPLKKAYAMYKLYLSETNDMPLGSRRSTSVVWTTDKSLISNVTIDDNNVSLENAKIRVTLNANKYGNAVIAFNLGNTVNPWENGSNNADPIIWSWHIWAPKSVVQESTEYITENQANDGTNLDNSGQFVHSVKSYYGVPLETTLMDRDLGAVGAFINQHLAESGYLGTFYYNAANPNYAGNAIIQKIKDSGGLHFQWGRKDPLPVFYYPGGFYEHSAGGSTRDLFRKYPIFRQVNNINGTIVYSNAVDETNYLANLSKEYSTYSNMITTNDSQYDKLKKVLKYSVNNPLTFMYQSNVANKDWISDQNGLATERWGHATEKSPYDPCPEGWRIPDVQGATVAGGNIYDGYLSYAKGNNPWFYNALFEETKNSKLYKYYGLDPANSLAPYPVRNEAYNKNRINYLGGYVRSQTTPGYPGRANVRYGFVFNNPRYNIGNYPNNAIRGFDGGNSLKGSMRDLSGYGVNENFNMSGVWTSGSIGDYALGMHFLVQTNNAETPENLFFFTPNYAFRPQAAMSCRCAKINYDVNKNEITRYEPFAIAVPKNTTGKAINTFAQKQLEEIQKDQKKLSVFPNPVKSLLYINADDKDYFYQIYNASGQLIKEGKFENKKTDLSLLTQGIYLVRINDAETVVKIIKE